MNRVLRKLKTFLKRKKPRIEDANVKAIKRGQLDLMKVDVESSRALLCGFIYDKSRYYSVQLGNCTL